MSVGTQKVWEIVGFGNTLPQYLPNPKNRFQVKILFMYLSYFELTKKLKQFFVLTNEGFWDNGI